MANCQLAHCNRHINCDYQGPKTEYAKKGLKNVSQEIRVTYQNYKIHKFKNIKLSIHATVFNCCREMNGVSNPHKNLSWGLEDCN